MTAAHGNRTEHTPRFLRYSGVEHSPPYLLELPAWLLSYPEALPLKAARVGRLSPLQEQRSAGALPILRHLARHEARSHHHIRKFSVIRQQVTDLRFGTSPAQTSGSESTQVRRVYELHQFHR